MVAIDSTFQRELWRWGPSGTGVVTSLAEANAYCRRLCQQHYENFAVASWFLPKRYRQDFATIYAFCRWSDDLADEVGDATQSLKLLDWWQQQLRDCFQTDISPTHPVMVSLRCTVNRHQMVIDPFEDLLRAFRQDQTQNRYTTRDELKDYCRGSANPVGRLVLRMADADSSDNILLSDCICTGLQLANFCQDMAVDARMNRIYAPADLMAAHQVTESMILQCKFRPELANMLISWCNEAREILVSGKNLLKSVPTWLRRDVDLFVRGGLAILDAIGNQGFDVWTTRPRVSKLTKLKLVLQMAWLCGCPAPERSAKS